MTAGQDKQVGWMQWENCIADTKIGVCGFAGDFIASTQDVRACLPPVMAGILYGWHPLMFV